MIYSECVFVALSNQHAMRLGQYFHLWPARLYNIFPNYLINGTIFGEEKKAIEHQMCVLIFYIFSSQIQLPSCTVALWLDMEFLETNVKPFFFSKFPFRLIFTVFFTVIQRA